jgi:hypothetical protein
MKAAVIFENGDPDVFVTRQGARSVSNPSARATRTARLQAALARARSR